MPILEAKGLVKIYGRRKVVKGVDMHVNAAEIVGLLGPNGAGKTTCFNMTCGLIEPNKGRVFVNDNDVTNWPMYRRAREGGVGYLAQDSSVFRTLSVEQNLLGMMELLGMGRKQRNDRCQQLLERFKITHIRKSKAGRLSGGERRRLEIARCLVSDPKIILLDEPFNGIDPVTVQGIQALICELRDQGISILITDHKARAILRISDRVYVISEGSVLCHGSPDEVRAHEEVRRKYLGDDDHDTPRSNPPPPAASAPEPAAPVARHPEPAASSVPAPHLPTTSAPRPRAATTVTPMRRSGE
ncbi:MAG: LPS export ABC transporter ATP-binding protein [Pirellulaceae bacterium]